MPQYHEEDDDSRPLLESSASFNARTQNNSHYMSLVHSIGLATVTKLPQQEASREISKTKSRACIACFLILVFLGACLFSVVAPFFPTRAMEKGMTQMTAGLVIGSMQLMQFVVSIILAFTMFHFGLKFLLCAGIFVASCCSILFGLLDYSPAGTTFTVLCFAVRIIQGLGISSYYIACFTMAAVLFTDNYGFIVGLLETAISLGFLLGPTIGGSLYSVGGYFAPFALLGGILFLCGPVVFAIIPSNVVNPNSASSLESQSPMNVFKVMFKPALLVVLYTMLTTTISWVFTETTLGVRLIEFGISDPFVIGVVYLSSSGAYALAAPSAGRLADKLDLGWGIMLLGTVMLSAGYLIVGPSPLFRDWIPPGIFQLVLGCILTHTGLAFVQIPTTRELQRQAAAYGLDPNDPSTLSFISAVFECTWGLGGFLGAFMSGALMENLGFPWATTVQAFVVLSCFFAQFYLIYKFSRNNDAISDKTTQTSVFRAVTSASKRITYGEI